jgi:NAD(P)H dehydrogenase (quinone)
MELFDRLSTALNCVTSYWQILPPFRENKRVLLILVHPCGLESFCGSCAQSALKGLKAAGHDVRFRAVYGVDTDDNLHKQKKVPDEFKPLPILLTPALGSMEKDKYSSLALQGSDEVSHAQQQIFEDLKWAQALVFVYPTWWMNVPATLKGFFDRCFLPHVAFEVKTGGLKPLLTNIEKVGVVSTYGAPEHIVFGAGDNGRNMISRCIRPLFHSSCTLKWLGLYEMDGTSKQSRECFLAQIEKSYKNF